MLAKARDLFRPGDGRVLSLRDHDAGPALTDLGLVSDRPARRQIPDLLIHDLQVRSFV